MRDAGWQPDLDRDVLVALKGAGKEVHAELEAFRMQVVRQAFQHGREPCEHARLWLDAPKLVAAVGAPA